MIRVFAFLCGAVLALGGVAALGGGFDFIDAHRSWPAWALLPAAACFGILSVSLAFIGMALCAAALRARATSPANDADAS